MTSKPEEAFSLFVDLCLVYAYRPGKLESASVVVSRRMAADGIAVGPDRAIAWLYVA